ncbi:uncharacterized protein LOC143453512 isoform X2 [Clavelina lepadiformis]|uniref:uncharacterized protein LOC143453512 isoform X2 n=1 Tax=Clavelina lepadiformis TaxID=159417 RepID=UPI0040439071
MHIGLSRDYFYASVLELTHFNMASPNLLLMRGYGELLFTILTFENAHRPSALRGMLVEEAKEANKSKKGLYLIRVMHHKTGLTSGPAQIVVRPAVKDALFTFIRLAPGQKFV